jgi:hypothetical protein
MTEQIQDSGSDIHIVPLNDLREHWLTRRCWCKPTPDMDDQSVVLHHSLDQRERYESGEMHLH